MGHGLSRMERGCAQHWAMAVVCQEPFASWQADTGENVNVRVVFGMHNWKKWGDIGAYPCKKTRSTGVHLIPLGNN